MKKDNISITKQIGTAIWNIERELLVDVSGNLIPIDINLERKLKEIGFKLDRLLEPTGIIR
ncbi:hypothetical protein [Candidatus Nitrosocosmicus sp. T]